MGTFYKNTLTFMGNDEQIFELQDLLKYNDFPIHNKSFYSDEICNATNVFGSRSGIEVHDIDDEHGMKLEWENFDGGCSIRFYTTNGSALVFLSLLGVWFPDLDCSLMYTSQETNYEEHDCYEVDGFGNVSYNHSELHIYSDSNGVYNSPFLDNRVVS
ncbi:hypothetical protein LNTAR_25440 [Lentisphaera araneosa HTCC2155]|uniref:Uncharacterized protein n=1 Tax=Lentisphaera araneosa HTCC2155 TaxID=313628 RepID=A6DSD0_9BACT|nr:hypothetical protein [Lentisphaera araneosa]EDM25475.1 hypothetical protein LNTAR_25440 [Lentisphaera araneosa HTCC2155]